MLSSQKQELESTNLVSLTTKQQYLSDVIKTDVRSDHHFSLR